MNWKFKFRLFQILTYGIVFAAIAIIVLFTGKFIEAIGLFVSFVSLRYAFDKTWHSKSFWKCIFISCIVFIFTISFLPNKRVSILASVIFGLIVDYAAYKYKDYDDLHLLVYKPFNVDTCSEAELLTRCKQVGLSEENTKLAVEFFIKKTKQSQIAELLYVEEHSITKRKLRLKRKLNK